MPAKRAPQDERFFPTVNHPPASLAPWVMVTYLILTPFCGLLAVAPAFGGMLGDSPDLATLLVVLVVMILPGAFFHLLSSAAARLSSGCLVAVDSVTLRIPRGDIVIPLSSLESWEGLDRLAFLGDPGIRGVSGFRTLEGPRFHSLHGDVYINIARDIMALDGEPPLVHLLLEDSPSIVVDPIDAVGFLECLDAIRTTGTLPPEPISFPCSATTVLLPWTSTRGMRLAVAGFSVAGGLIVTAQFILFGSCVFALLAAAFTTLIGFTLYDACRRPLDGDDVVREVKIDGARLTLQCGLKAVYFSLHNAEGVERLPYYDFWAEVGMERDPYDGPYFFRRTVPRAGGFHHPKHGRGYINWRRLLPIDERAKPLVALRLKDKSLVVVDVDDPDALEAALKQRLASLPAPVALPGETPE